MVNIKIGTEKTTTQSDRLLFYLFSQNIVDE